MLIGCVDRVCCTHLDPVSAVHADHISGGGKGHDVALHAIVAVRQDLRGAGGRRGRIIVGG